MLEGIICGFLIFSAGYVGFLRLMARRDDVLHGEFIQADGSRAAAPRLSVLAEIERYLQGSGLFAKR